MFEVQIVRHRKGARLQVLRRRFMMIVTDRCMKISLRSPSSGERQLDVINISYNRIKSVRVRERLLRVVVDKGAFITVRLQDRDEALRAAESMMETWDIDPLVEGSEVPPAEAEEKVDCGVEGLVKLYMGDQQFRHLVHSIHDHIDTVLANEESCYVARV